MQGHLEEVLTGSDSRMHISLLVYLPAAFATFSIASEGLIAEEQPLKQDATMLSAVTFTT